MANSYIVSVKIVATAILNVCPKVFYIMIAATTRFLVDRPVDGNGASILLFSHFLCVCSFHFFQRLCSLVRGVAARGHDRIVKCLPLHFLHLRSS